MMQRLRQGKDRDSKLKNQLAKFAEGRFVTILMSVVTIFALIGDDLRLWTFDKPADVFFNTGMILSLVLFTLEILLNTVSIDEFKYSFFFWLDIIATLSVVIDIPWITDPMNESLMNNTPSYLEVNVSPGTNVTFSSA